MTGSPSSRTVFIRGLQLAAKIGVYAHEKDRAQPIRVDVDLHVREPDDPLADSFEDVVCYNRFSRAIIDLVDAGHIGLVETLAEQICAMGLDHPLVHAIRVRIEKPDAILAADAAGVEIYRSL